jgi:hypothetical protein
MIEKLNIKNVLCQQADMPAVGNNGNIVESHSSSSTIIKYHYRISCFPMQCKKQCKEKMSFAQDYTLFTQCLLQFKQSYATLKT